MVKSFLKQRSKGPGSLDENAGDLKQSYTNPESPASSTEGDLLGFGNDDSTALVVTKVAPESTYSNYNMSSAAPEPDLLFMDGGADSTAIVPSETQSSPYGDEILLQFGEEQATADLGNLTLGEAAVLPQLDDSKVVAEGSLWGRVTRNKMLTKEWQELTWMQYGRSTLYLFKSRQDYMDWRHYTMNGGAITEQARDRLVKKVIDFSQEVKKPNVKGFSLGPVKDKTYHQVGRGSPLYNFKLECWHKVAPVTVAAFGSIVKEEAEAFYKRLEEMYTTAFNESVPNK